MDLDATPIFEISVKNCKSEPELKFEVENRKLILPQRTCELVTESQLGEKQMKPPKAREQMTRKWKNIPSFASLA